MSTNTNKSLVEQINEVAELGAFKKNEEFEKRVRALRTVVEGRIVVLLDELYELNQKAPMINICLAGNVRVRDFVLGIVHEMGYVLRDRNSNID